MTLIASLPTPTLNQSDALSLHDDITSYNDDEPKPIDDAFVSMQQQTSQIDCADALVQYLGHPDSDLAPTIGQVSIENSSDVHFGDKNIYQGPVTIKQIVYANGSASLAPNCDKARDNLAFEGDSDSDDADVKTSEGNSKTDVLEPEETGYLPSGFGKGLIWLQNVSKQRHMEIGIFVIVLVLFVVVLLLVVFLRNPSADKALQVTHTSAQNEPDIVKPIEYNPDITATSQIKNRLRLISRYEWLAQPPLKDRTPLVTPVPLVIIHHTATENCSSQAQCVFHVRQIQTFHIESRGWYDIGYNFLVGGDGAAYEGRGWTVEGAHTLGWNGKSIGIAFVGTFIQRPPPQIQMVACKKVIEQGVALGYIKKDYKLLGARQLFATESPGTALLEEIKTWPNWEKEP